ncbi:MAG: hypothetical protein ACOY4H_07550, partial [Thermodesulfobacteriota bacterium]
SQPARCRLRPPEGDPCRRKKAAAANLATASFRAGRHIVTPKPFFLIFTATFRYRQAEKKCQEIFFSPGDGGGFPLSALSAFVLQ